MTPVITAPSPSPARQPARGHCSKCRRVWVLNEGQGICRWCGNSASCQSTVAKPRHLNSKRNRRPEQAHNGGNRYDQLPDQQGWIATADGFRWVTVQWGTYYKVAVRFAVKAISGEKDDLLHTIMESLAAVHRRKLARGQDFTEAAMYRTAEHIKDWYWYKRYSYNNGLDCRHCSREQRAKCKHNWSWSEWAYSDCHRAIRLESLNQPITDEEGNLTDLSELIADDDALDLDEWVLIRTFLIGAPIRLKAIAMKKRDGQALTQPEYQYLSKLRKRYQKTLV